MGRVIRVKCMFAMFTGSCSPDVASRARGRYLVVNMDDASQIAAIGEPLFLGLGATVQIHRMVTLDDMPRVTEAVEQAVQKYG